MIMGIHAIFYNEVEMDNVKVVPESFKSSHKFGHDPLTEALYELSLDTSNADDEAGESDGPAGWNTLFHFEQAEDVKVNPDYYGEGKPEAIVTVPRGSYILTSDSSGFVYVRRYDYQSPEVGEEWSSILDIAYEYEDEPY